MSCCFHAKQYIRISEYVNPKKIVKNGASMVIIITDRQQMQSCTAMPKGQLFQVNISTAQRSGNCHRFILAFSPADKMS